MELPLCTTKFLNRAEASKETSNLMVCPILNSPLSRDKPTLGASKANTPLSSSSLHAISKNNEQSPIPKYFFNDIFLEFKVNSKPGGPIIDFIIDHLAPNGLIGDHWIVGEVNEFNEQG